MKWAVGGFFAAGVPVEKTRLQIIEMLTFPRLMALDSMELDGCPHEGQFEADSSRCKTCEYMYECTWLKSNEPFLALASSPVDELLNALRFAIDYVDSQNHRSGVARTFCVCKNCSWINSAKLLLKSTEGRSEIVHSD